MTKRSRTGASELIGMRLRRVDLYTIVNSRIRAAKVAGIAQDIAPVEVDDPDDGGAELLVVGWGSTWGAILEATRRARTRGKHVAHVQLMHLNPFPPNLGDVLGRYRKVLIPEMNLGQLSVLIRSRYLVDAQTLSKVQGLPFRASEIEAAMVALLEGKVAR